jgi:FkbM family methyltransferase
MSESSSSSASPLLYAKNRLKEILRPFIPAHVRFRRAGEGFLRGGEREVHELGRLVTPGTTAVDVGAHIGDYTYSLCKHVGPNGHVIAVEPLPDLARMLTKATAKLNLPVTVVNCALSTQPGEAELRVPWEGGERMAGYATLESRETAEGGQVFRVKVRTLDDVCAGAASRISFIKIDVEGHELSVLRGGIEMLKKHRPNLLIEIEQRHSAVPIGETFAFIESQGYRGEFLTPDRQPHELSEFKMDVHQPENAARGQYVSNFIFMPA